ncbi:TPA: hypothetical protein DIV55_01905 [Patescibacteria group bacterium]|uniref:Purine phosphoribosyltransferase n=1 Tax=Candidatus Gottesmanbacteria bacterium GW2011_GWA1_43_11 TaxID=1618436 RepID=A0A0G1CFU2_9BACT|nr:MAG: Purine phosphoribosyltransferase [Candidatus Gottesmanbacteria bacterium GW2011_GWA1_43_11]HCS78477.1 hypothetical protein [Patescibacteria group bacterium]
MSTNWRSKFLNVSWSDFCTQAFVLSKQIRVSSRPLDLIVAIARGGLTLSQLLSDSLSLPIATFTIQSYKDLRQQTLPQITFGVGTTTLEGKRVLLVDDVCDTGKTFERALVYVSELGAEKEQITTAALHYKPHAIYKPDFFVTKTDKWVIYPYEVWETIAQLSKLWKADKISAEEINARFLAFGFLQEQLTQFYPAASYDR